MKSCGKNEIEARGYVVNLSFRSNILASNWKKGFSNLRDPATIGFLELVIWNIFQLGYGGWSNMCTATVIYSYTGNDISSGSDSWDSPSKLSQSP